jgi:hypothetical protein
MADGRAAICFLEIIESHFFNVFLDELEHASVNCIWVFFFKFCDPEFVFLLKYSQLHFKLLNELIYNHIDCWTSEEDNQLVALK